jgi:hypothetical protein
MARPIPSDNAVTYDAAVTITFYFTLEADDDMQAEELASYEWQDNLYRGEIGEIYVEMIEDDSDEAIGGDDDE